MAELTRTEAAVDWGKCAVEAVENGQSIDIGNNLPNFKALVEFASGAG